MLDRPARRLVDPLLNGIADRCVAWGFSANQMSTAGFLVGMAAAVAVAREQYLLGLLLLLINRLADGIDGAIARKSVPTDFGAYLDIVFDFILYAAVPRAQRWVARAIWVVIILLGYFSKSWLIWGVIVLLLSRGQFGHPPVLDAYRPLPKSRIWLLVASILLFVLSFTPVPSP